VCLVMRGILDCVCSFVVSHERRPPAGSPHCRRPTNPREGYHSSPIPNLPQRGVPRIIGGQERLNRLLPTLGRSVALTILVREYRECGPAWRDLSLTGLLPADNLNWSQRSLLNYGLTGFECHPALSG